MQPPCEIMMTRFLPNMRGIVAHELSERGESQRTIATELGITQARVSHYLSKRKLIYYSALFRAFGITESELEGYARVLAEDVTRSQVDGIFTLYSIWKNMLFNGRVCELHQRESAVATECSVCMDIHRPQSDAKLSRHEDADDEFLILHNLSDAVALVEGSTVFTRIMPEVSVNIAMCRARPASRSDVAAIPGRINKIHGRAKAFVLPEFGSSNHLSNVLLLVNSKLPRIRAVMNLRFDELMEASLDCLEIGKTFTNEVTSSKDQHSKTSDEIILRKLSAVKVPDSTGKNQETFAVIDRGSEGLEPITYLFGTKATQVSDVALRVAREYARR